MQIAGAYLLVVLIWSTTPLAIHWSNESFSFVTAVSLRMVLALLVSYTLLAALKTRLIQQPKDWLVYLAGGFGLFPNMLLVYWAAQHIPSGLMSVVMGVYPFFVGFFAWAFFKEKAFTPAKIFAVVMALSGLVVIHFGQLKVGASAALGVAIMILACLLWSISSVWVKHLGQGVEPLRQGTGSLLVATPLFVVSWWFLDGTVPNALTSKSVLGVGYLVLAGSVVGHTLFFYILRKCSVVTVSLITLLAPVLAMTWGVMIEGESFSTQTLCGVTLVLVSLVFYQGIHRQIYLWLRRTLDVVRGKKPVLVRPLNAK